MDDKKYKDMLLGIGHIFKKYRKDMRLTQEELAKSLKMERKHISAIENGRQNMTIETLCKLCNALNISVVDVFKEVKICLESQKL